MISKTSDNTEPLIEWRSGCPVSCALDVLGDKWSLLIVRDLILHGKRTYSEFGNSPEKIATNILSNRLKLLAQLKLITRVDPEGSVRGNAYELTERGKALKPILVEYGKWAHANLKEFNDRMVPM